MRTTRTRTLHSGFGLDLAKTVEISEPVPEPPNWGILAIGLTEADVRSGLERGTIGRPEARALLRAIRAKG